MLHYCKRCGDIEKIYANKEKKCGFCQCELYPVPREYLCENIDDAFKSRELKQEFIEKVIKTSPEFEQERMDRQKEYYAREARIDAEWEGKAMGNPWGVHCPYCNCTIIERTSGMNRSTWFADAATIGKQFQCLKCKAFF